MTGSKLVIGTRGSALALWQAHHVKARLEADDPALTVELVVLKTKGDKILDAPLAKVGGKGLFVKEIEEALLRRQVDLAVHSMKDVPAELEPGLVLCAVSAREDPHDVIVSRHPGGLGGLPPGANVGTSSLRRMCQLRARRPDLRITALRGNVDTRLRKLDAGDFDAIVLAAAGLVRLGHGDRISERLPFDVSLPAIGQGALGLETRADDAPVMARVRRVLHDEAAAACVTAERAFLARLDGGCQTPIAAHAVIEWAELGEAQPASPGSAGRGRSLSIDGNEVALDGLVGDPEGREILRDRLRGAPAAAAALGRDLAERLLHRGAAVILERCKAEALVVGGA